MAFKMTSTQPRPGNLKRTPTNAAPSNGNSARPARPDLSRMRSKSYTNLRSPAQNMGSSYSAPTSNAGAPPLQRPTVSRTRSKSQPPVSRLDRGLERKPTLRREPSYGDGLSQPSRGLERKPTLRREPSFGDALPRSSTNAMSSGERAYPPMPTRGLQRPPMEMRPQQPMYTPAPPSSRSTPHRPPSGFAPQELRRAPTMSSQAEPPSLRRAPQPVGYPSVRPAPSGLRNQNASEIQYPTIPRASAPTPNLQNPSLVRSSPYGAPPTSRFAPAPSNGYAPSSLRGGPRPSSMQTAPRPAVNRDPSGGQPNLRRSLLQGSARAAGFGGGLRPPTAHSHVEDYVKRARLGDQSAQSQKVVLYRGVEGNTREAIYRNRTANGAALNPNAMAPSESSALNQAAIGRGLPEYTSSVDVANGFSRGHHLIAVEVEAKYLTPGSRSESGWVISPDAPVNVLGSEDRTGGQPERFIPNAS